MLLGGLWLLALSFRPPRRAPDPQAARRILRSGSVLSLVMALVLAATWYVESSQWFAVRLGARFTFLVGHLTVGALAVRWFFRSNRDLLTRYQIRKD